MDVTPLIRRDTKVIQSYKDGVFKISGQTFVVPVIVMADHLFEWTQGNEPLDVESFVALAPYADDIEILLVGTGRTTRLIPHALRLAVKQRYGFSIDSMDTGAACRTYNVLMAEGRRIAVALQLYN